MAALDCWRLDQLDDELELRDTDEGEQQRRHLTLRIKNIYTTVLTPRTEAGDERNSFNCRVGSRLITVNPPGVGKLSCEADGYGPESEGSEKVSRVQSWEWFGEWEDFDWTLGGIFLTNYWLESFQDTVERRDTDIGVQKRNHFEVARWRTELANNLNSKVGKSTLSASYQIRNNLLIKFYVSGSDSQRKYVCTRESYTVPGNQWHTGMWRKTQFFEMYDEWELDT